uniref:PPFIA binding protein 1b n=1 Tax=Oryzias sinensis TaxID=183150 RepID=A0A8C7ZFK2_9TELE
MMSDASDMLAAALEQMDGIIAGSKALDYSNGLFDCQSPTSPFMGGLRALHLLEDLRSILDLMDTEEREGLRCQIPDSTADSVSNGHVSVGGGDHYQERLSRLENDKESLVLQVSVLTDQVEAQGEKIRDLDLCLEEHREKLNATEEMLQQELLCRTALETQKLELMSEVSNLKLKLNSIEKEKQDFDHGFRDSEVSELRWTETYFYVNTHTFFKYSCMLGSFFNFLIRRLSSFFNLFFYENVVQITESDIFFFSMKLEGKDGEMKKLHDETVFKLISSSGADTTDRNVEVQRMKKAVESLMVANEEKDRKIDELKQSLLRYKKVQDMVMSVQGKKGEYMESPSDESSTCSPANSVCVESEKQATNEEMSKTREKPPIGSTAPSQSSTEDDSFGSRKARSSFGKGFFKIRGGKKTTGSPNLGKSQTMFVCSAETERQGTDHLDLAGLPQTSSSNDGTQTLPATHENRKKSKGIKKLFGKLKRSQSTTFNLDDNLPEGEFKRGGVRATAGPRLGWSRDLQRGNNDVDAPFARWSKDQVCNWLQEQGLGLYVNMARVWISSGQTLLQASQLDLEKELGIKHPLHRKKLQLALQALGSEEEDNKGKLDYNWVTRWLDDIGLPQYKTQFDEARVDGRMLHYMTVDDLLSLKVGSVLHHLSIKRAIQVLRLNNFEPNCLRRRPSDENNISPAEVSQWTNHRVMEWLRSVDLAEYAPNLRGSGVHGGLMVLEPRFNVETMALLLNIPPNKTLLRRHLATHFSLLIGAEAQQLKQECLENPDYTVLTATTKVKPKKLPFSNFGSLRKKKQDESEEYVCPMDVEMPKGQSFQRGFELQIYEDDLDRLEQMEDSEGTVRQIGAFSEGIQNLTSMLKDDEFFKEVSNSPNLSVTDEDSNA